MIIARKMLKCSNKKGDTGTEQAKLNVLYITLGSAVLMLAVVTILGKKKRTINSK